MRSIIEFIECILLTLGLIFLFLIISIVVNKNSVFITGDKNKAEEIDKILIDCDYFKLRFIKEGI